MAFWSRMFGRGDDVTPNANGPEDINPGDPHGVELDDFETYSRSAPFPVPSSWAGWPGEWSTPTWNSQSAGVFNGAQVGLNRLVDTAWACLDLNSSVLSSMPVYRTQSGRIVSSMSWMTNPDPMIYSSWQEFAKQLFWDYQMGEAFVMPMAKTASGWPLRFRVVPPWLVNVELSNGTRTYSIGGEDLTGEILHIRYMSNIADARGHGPLEVAGARMTAAALLQRYAQTIAETGGTPLYWLEVARRLNETEANDLLNRWVESRVQRAGQPALVSGGASLHQGQSMSAKDLTLLELAQFNESRIAILLGVPPFLVGLPSGGDSMTYSNVSQLFDFHDRSSLRPKATGVMSAMSGWALPRGQACELNREEYTRPGLFERAQSYSLLFNIVDPTSGQRAITVDQIRAMERFEGESAAVNLTGGDDTSITTPNPSALSGGNQ